MAMENIVQQFYTELFLSSTLVPRCPLPPPDDLLPILECRESKTILLFKKRSAGRYCRLPPNQSALGCIQDVHQDPPQPHGKNFGRLPTSTASRFRKNFSCMDRQQAVTQLIEMSREYQLPPVLVFVDCKKAFDSVETNAVLNALAHAGVPSVYIRLLKQCFSDNSAIIQLFDRKLKILIERGVRKGNTISPKLFTAALQYAMSKLDWEDKAYSIDGTKISNLRSADDIVLIANSAAEMETMVNELNVAGLKIGLEINMSKT
ncbi:hypothetical protein Y032_0006g2912 [Ancylostoma ceylanicum]|uniref:Reverse transcriptase domain-containing protein n=1 Tax=Ancylostoma ceylanicum TaxID=53326 RepID=A0A016VNZ8_9BILA|nr:hypothetical protein Y032_0006g2912 [Ancylostoma ceylanicum]